MSEGDVRAVGDVVPSAAAAKTPGEMLREERLRQKLSVQQAAEDLHLDVRSVEAIEADDFKALGAPVFARGHLRKYAQLLNLPPELVIGRYEALGDLGVPTPIPAATWMMVQPRRRVSLRLPWHLRIAVIVLVLGGIGLWGFDTWYS